MNYCDTVARIALEFGQLLPWLTAAILFFTFMGIFMSLTHRGQLTQPFRLATVIFVFTLAVWVGLSLLSCNVEPDTGTETLPEVPNPQDVAL